MLRTLTDDEVKKRYDQLMEENTRLADFADFAEKLYIETGLDWGVICFVWKVVKSSDEESRKLLNELLAVHERIKKYLLKKEKEEEKNVPPA